MTPVVRRAGADDWAAVKAVRLAALTDSPLAFASTLERESAFPDAEWQQRAAGGNWMLACVDGAVVGVAAGYAEPSRPDDERELVSMWVAPGWRGRGVAEPLVIAVADWAREQGARRLGLWVVRSNPRARALYERVGFVASGESMPLPHDPRETEDRMLLAL